MITATGYKANDDYFISYTFKTTSISLTYVYRNIDLHISL